MDIHEIAAAIAAPGSNLRLRQGKITAVASDGTLSVQIAGSTTTITGVKALASVCPKINAGVWLATDGADLFAIGTIAPVGPAYCSIMRTTSLSVGNTTDTQVNFLSTATVEADTHGMFSTSTPTYLTCQVPGVYQVSTAVAFAAGGTGLRSVWFQVGSNIAARDMRPPSGVGTNILALAALVPMAAGDQLSLYVRQSQGTALDLTAGAYYPRLRACWLRPPVV